MTNRPALLRQIYTEARPYVEQLVELNVAFTGFRKLATDNGLDWGQIKALLRAEIEDGEEGGSEKVDRIIKKAEYAGEYAALLGLGTSNMNERNSISSDLPLHDVDGVIIELPPAEPVRPSAGIQGSGSPAEENGPLNSDGLSGPSSEEGAAIALNASSSQIKSNAKATEVEPGNAGGTVPVRHNNDRAGVASRLAGGRTPDSEEGGSCALGASPSSHPLSPSGELTATGTNGGDHEDEVATAILKSSDNRQVLDEPSGADPGSAVESGAQVSEVAAIAPASAAIAPVELSPSRDVAPGAPFPCEANGWAGLEPLPQFDRRRPAA